MGCSQSKDVSDVAVIDKKDGGNEKIGQGTLGSGSASKSTTFKGVFGALN